jgi:hypothetical protein
MAPKLSHGGEYYRRYRGRELSRKKIERARLASAAYGFIERHPSYADRWRPRYNEKEGVYTLSAKQEQDWRRFLKEHGWAVGEKGRKARIEGGDTEYRARPLTPEQEAARKRFSEEAMGRAPGSYAAVYA